MKKLIALLLALVMVCGMVACGGGGEDEPSVAPTAPPTSGTQPTEPKGEPVYIAENAKEITGTVKYYSAFSLTQGVQAMIDEFNKHYPNITIEATVYKNSDEGNLGLDTALMAGGQVDVFQSYGIHNTSARWENNMVWDLTDLMAKDNLDLVKEWGTDTYVYNGRIYCFPSGGLKCYIAINMKAWEEAGLGEYPTLEKGWTWDEYIEACRKLTKRDESGKTVVYGGGDYNSTEYWTYPLRQSKGTNFYYDMTDGLSDFDNPLFAKVLQRELDCAAEGIWYPKAKYKADKTKSRDMFLQGVVATSVESIVTRYMVAKEPSEIGFKTYYAPYPVNAAGEVNYMTSAHNNSFVMISKKTENIDAAYAWAKWVATYGNKYMFAAGHAAMWTGTNAEDVVDVVFGSKERAETYVDVDSFIENSVSIGGPFYKEDYIPAYNVIHGEIMDEIVPLVFDGTYTVADAIAEMKELADEAIKEALKK